jgi:hypothetical protein
MDPPLDLLRVLSPTGIEIFWYFNKFRQMQGEDSVCALIALEDIECNQFFDLLFLLVLPGSVLLF